MQSVCALRPTARLRGEPPRAGDGRAHHCLGRYRPGDDPPREIERDLPETIGGPNLLRPRAGGRAQAQRQGQRQRAAQREHGAEPQRIRRGMVGCGRTQLDIGPDDRQANGGAGVPVDAHHTGQQPEDQHARDRGG